MHPSSKSLLSVAVGLALLTDFAVASSNKITVTGHSLEATQAELSNIAGGTNLISPQGEARLSTLKDALDYQPGILIQEFFGGIDQPRLNIRGSGIQSNPVNRGVLLLEDGLPINEADGSFVIGTLEARDAQSIIVKRGANAREPGATTLGGSLNFVPQYGASESNSVRLEAGSFGRYGAQASLNSALESGDSHLSASADTYDGFRNRSSGDRQALRSNLGLQINDALSSRFYLSYTDLAFDIPFVVPKSRVDSDPKGVMGDGNTPMDSLLNTYKRKPHRETEQFRLANRTQWQVTETSSQEFGVYVQETDDSFVDPLSHADTESQTLGLQWTYDFLAGETDLQLAISWNQSDMQRAYHANNPANGEKLQQFGDLDMDAQNTNIGLVINHPLSETLSLDSQLRWNRSCRDAADRISNTQLDQCWNGGNASLGLNLRTSEQQRWFANISSSSEAPTFWEITATNVAPNNPASASLALTELELQKAVTLEVGGQGMLMANHAWDLSVYRSEVEDELISTANMVGGRGVTSNYSDTTIHQGIELGLRSDEQLHYRLAWNYSDFTFDGGIYDGNNIAGIPEHMISAELGYRMGEWDLSTNLRWMPEETAVDHENGLYQDDYAIWGLEADYQPASKAWRGFVRVDNITDETYASAFVIRNRSSAAQPTFLPGNGRSISAGVQLKF